MEAIVKGINLGISRKVSIEICNLIRSKSTEQAKKILQRVIEKKQAVPYKIFTGNIPHKKGKIAAGRYPQKATKTILGLINSAESNAQDRGMSNNLIISHISAHKGETQSRYGRKMGQVAKRTHINLTVKEKK